MNLDSEALEIWDNLRRAKEAGKIRAIGVACHTERSMTRALAELDGLDFVWLPLTFLPAALSKGVGLIGMKPLAAGSIMKLDARARPGAKPENERIRLWERQNKPILAKYARRVTELCPGRPFTLETIVGPPRIYPVFRHEFWEGYKKTPAWEFARFSALAEGVSPRAPFVPAPKQTTAESARADLEAGLRYARSVLAG